MLGSWWKIGVSPCLPAALELPSPSVSQLPVECGPDPVSFWALTVANCIGYICVAWRTSFLLFILNLPTDSKTIRPWMAIPLLSWFCNTYLTFLSPHPNVFQDGDSTVYAAGLWLGITLILSSQLLPSFFCYAAFELGIMRVGWWMCLLALWHSAFCCRNF